MKPSVGAHGMEPELCINLISLASVAESSLVSTRVMYLSSPDGARETGLQDAKPNDKFLMFSTVVVAVVCRFGENGPQFAVGWKCEH